MCHVRGLCRCSCSAGLEQSLFGPDGPHTSLSDPRRYPCLHMCNTSSERFSSRELQKFRETGTLTHTHAHAHTHTHTQPTKKNCVTLSKKGRCALLMPALRFTVEGHASYKNMYSTATAPSGAHSWGSCSKFHRRTSANSKAASLPQPFDSLIAACADAPATAEGNCARRKSTA